LIRQLLNHTIFTAAGVAINLLLFNSSQAQAGRWAGAGDPTAKTLIDMERQWAEAACTHNGIEKTILAEDFHGTAPSGSQYSKQEALADAAQSKASDQACTMYEVKVHFYGDSMAVLYGSESAVRTEADGRKHTVKLTWTDTWLRRGGKWQIVAAQDMPSEIN